jgi:hypothetical protein
MQMHTERRSHRGLAALAGEQWGVVSVRQLDGLDYPRQTVKAMVRTGRLHPVFRGVYAVGHSAISQHAWCLAAVFSCEDGSLLSHRSAAWLWGLTKRFANPIEVTAASPRRTRGAIRVHSADALTDLDATRREGIPVTAPPRTFLDFAARDPHYLGQALDNGHRLGLVDLIDLDELISRSSGFRGVGRLRTALEIHRPASFRCSAEPTSPSRR